MKIFDESGQMSTQFFAISSAFARLRAYAGRPVTALALTLLNG